MSVEFIEEKHDAECPVRHRAVPYVLRIAFVVFVAEAFIMVGFSNLGQMDRQLAAVLDATVLLVLLTPALYAMVYRPLAREVRMRITAQRELEKANRKLGEFAENLKAEVIVKAEALRTTDAQYTAMLENSNDIIVVLDSSLRVVFWNRRAEQAFGYTRTEAIGMNALFLVPSEQRADQEKEFRCAFRNGRNSSGPKLYESTGLKKNGGGFPMEVSYSVYSGGEKTFAAAIIRDISERKSSEIRITEQLERQKALRTIDMAITSSLDLRVTLNVVLEQVIKTLHVDAVDILLLNPLTLRLEFGAGSGFRTEALKQTRLRLGEGYSGLAAYEARIVSIPNLEEEEGMLEDSPYLASEGFVSLYCVPLVSKGTVKGVMEIFQRSHREHDREYFRFLDSIALQAAIAIDNSTMFNDLYKSNMELGLAYETTIEGWSRALDLRDKETEGHSQRVTEITVRIARAMGMKEEDIVHVRRGALLHDIGKMGIPDAILLKPGKLDDSEWETMRKHPIYAYELLSPVAYLRPALDIPYCHHERWDGKGYPRGLKGEDIPLAARIFSVVDVWDALMSDRPYRPAWPEEKVRAHLLALAGTELDPAVVDVFLKGEW